MLVVLLLSCLACHQKIWLVDCVSAENLVKAFWKMLSVGEDLGADLVFSAALLQGQVPSPWLSFHRIGQAMGMQSCACLDFLIFFFNYFLFWLQTWKPRHRGSPGSLGQLLAPCLLSGCSCHGFQVSSSC